MSGPQLLEELVRRGHDIPTIFITAYSDDWVHPEMLRRGAVAFLSKPFSETALLEAVNAALRKAEK
jgi:FixJ family two-component response regulator